MTCAPLLYFPALLAHAHGQYTLAPSVNAQEILKEYSKEVIRVQPADILAWSAK